MVYSSIGYDEIEAGTMNLHLLCRGRANLRQIEPSPPTFQTGVWRMPEALARMATHVWLHEEQKAASYHGGRIILVRPAAPEDAPDIVPGSFASRWVFVYRAEPTRMRAPAQWRNFAWTTD
jgi:hypothetical protein